MIGFGSALVAHVSLTAFCSAKCRKEIVMNVLKIIGY